MAGKNLFKEHWINKTHDVKIQDKLGEVMDMVHELDERLDTYESAGGTKKATNIVCPKCGAANPPTEMACLECGANLKTNKSILEDVMKEVESATTKSQLDAIKIRLQKAIDTAYAGGTPKSLLAEQDLETKKAMVDCPYCDGRGYEDEDPNVDCQYCMGEGKVDSKDLKDYDKSQNEQKKCPDCGGSGIMNEGDSDEKECDTCGGRGEIDKSQMHKDSIPSIQDVDENYKGKVRGIHNNKVYDSVEDYNLSSDDNPTNKSQGRAIRAEDAKVGMKVGRNGRVYTITSVKDDGIYVEIGLDGTKVNELHGNYAGYLEKGAIESTGKQLDQAAEKAESKHDLVTNIKNIQLKRQAATISEREKSMDKSISFKDFWKNRNTINKDMVTDMMAWEEGDLSESDEIKLFQTLVSSGQAWSLQGVYGRTARDLINAGLVKDPRNKRILNE